MSERKRVLVCEFHQESDTFNPLVSTLENCFEKVRCAEGKEAYDLAKAVPCALHGMIDAVEEFGGELILSQSLFGGSGGRVADDALNFLKEKVSADIAKYSPLDAVFVSLHGACCTESEDDASGALLAFIRELVGPDVVMAASCDLHANTTPQMLAAADIICGYQTYPHVDFYETGYRAASLGMRKLAGESVCLAATTIPMMTPPAGYTTQAEPFKSVVDYAKSLVADGTLQDYTIFNVQPWLDIDTIGCTIIAVASDAAMACNYADDLAQRFFAIRDGLWPDLMSVDEIIDLAENPDTPKPVILVDSADSPNGGAVGDSAYVALRLQERNATIRSGMFVKDPEAAKKAFEVGVGNKAYFEVGNKFTPDMPAPLKGEAVVRSLHDGDFLQEGPAGKGLHCNVGLSAVLSFGFVDIMVCEQPGASGDPQILRHFGIEPKVYDLIVVKANTSFRVPYSAFASVMCNADTPGAGTSNLKRLVWRKLPKNFYPFDLAEDYVPAPATIRRG